MSDEYQAHLAYRIRHEIDLWIERQIREGNIGRYAVPVVELHGLLVNLLNVMTVTRKTEKQYDG